MPAAHPPSPRRQRPDDQAHSLNCSARAWTFAGVAAAPWLYPGRWQKSQGFPYVPAILQHKRSYSDGTQSSRGVPGCGTLAPVKIQLEKTSQDVIIFEIVRPVVGIEYRFIQLTMG